MWNWGIGKWRRYWPGGGLGGIPLEGIVSPGVGIKDPIGRVAADREAGADYAGHTEGGGRGNELVTVSPEAWAIIWMKSVDEIIE